MNFPLAQFDEPAAKPPPVDASNHISEQVDWPVLRPYLIGIVVMTALWAMIGLLGFTFLESDRRDVIIALLAGGFGTMVVSVPFAWFHQRNISKAIARPVGAIESAEESLSGLIDDENGATANIAEQDLIERLAWLERRINSLVRGARAVAVEREYSREVATEQSRAKVRFFAAMSHELRTPLNAILGYSTLLQEDAVERQDDAGAADLAKIQVSGRRLLMLIDDLLDISGLQEGRREHDRSSFSLSSVLAEALPQECETQAQGQVVELVNNAPETMLIADRYKVGRCLKNLIASATHNSTDGRVMVEAELEQDANRVLVTISDNGPAITEAHLENILEESEQGAARSGKLAQSDEGKLRKGAVGLAVARTLLRSMGGDCVAVAGQDNGAVTMILPVNATTSQPITQKNDKPDGTVREMNIVDLEPSAEGNEVALIIDDDPAAVDLLSRWLKRSGYHIISALNGDEGLNLAKTYRPHIILLDALMPGRTGYDVLAEIRSDSEIGDTPVLLITVDDDRARGINAGASDFVRKPVSEAQLRALVSSYENDRRGEVLVIDDDDDAADIMCRNLHRLGYQTRRAADGAEGLELARQEKPAAIILDLNMPRVNGFDFIEGVATDHELSEVPILVVSGHELSLPQHSMLVEAGAKFFSKGHAAPREIVATLKELVS